VYICFTEIKHKTFFGIKHITQIKRYAIRRRMNVCKHIFYSNSTFGAFWVLNNVDIFNTCTSTAKFKSMRNAHALIISVSLRYRRLLFAQIYKSFFHWATGKIFLYIYFIFIFTTTYNLNESMPSIVMLL